MLKASPLAEARGLHGIEGFRHFVSQRVELVLVGPQSGIPQLEQRAQFSTIRSERCLGIDDLDRHRSTNTHSHRDIVTLTPNDQRKSRRQHRHLSLPTLVQLDRNPLGQLIDEFSTLVEQVIGLNTLSDESLNLGVQISDATGQRVHFVDGRLDRAIQILTHPVHVS